MYWETKKFVWLFIVIFTLLWWSRAEPVCLQGMPVYVCVYIYIHTHKHNDQKGMYRLLTREGNGTPLQYSCLGDPMEGGTWWAAVHGVAESWTQLSDFTFTFHFDVLEKEMATHSSVLAWRIPEMGEPGGLPSMGSHRVRHDWSDLAAAAGC